jgi:sugar lactone lactonase YvrE
MAKIFNEKNFIVVNKNNKNDLFRTDDPNVNQLTFSFENISTEDVIFKVGEKTSTIQFNMAFLKKDNDDPVKDFIISLPEGWKCGLQINPKGKYAEWKLTPKGDVAVAPGQKLSFVIKNIICKRFDPGYFSIKTTDIPDYEDVEPSIIKGITVKDPDKTKDRLPLVAGFTDPIHPVNNQTGFPCNNTKSGRTREITPNREAIPIYINYDPFAKIKNGFKLILTAEDDIVIPEVTDETRKPTIRVMFMFGSYPYEVTTQSKGNDIEINANQTKWMVRHNDDNPFWELIPEPQTINQFTTFSFNVRGIVTPEQALQGVSLIYVQVNNFGAYADDVYRYQLEKKPVVKPGMISLQRDAETINIGENLKLCWDSSLARMVEITYDTRDRERVVLSTAPGPGEYKIELTQCEFEALPVPPTALVTTFKATAYGPNGSKSSLSVAASVKQRIAEIVSFTATPNVIKKGVATKVTFAWNVRDASQLKLFKGDVELDISKREIEIDGPGEYKLVARSYGDELPNVSKTIKIYAYDNLTTIPFNFPGDSPGDRPRTLLYNLFLPNDEGKTFKYLMAHCGRDEMYAIHAEKKGRVGTYSTKRDCFALEPIEQKLLPLYSTRPGHQTGVYYIVGALIVPMPFRLPDSEDIATPMRFSPDGSKLFITYNSTSSTRENEINVNTGVISGPQRATYFESDGKLPLPKLKPGLMNELITDGPTLIGFDASNSSVFYISYNDKRIHCANYKTEGQISFTNVDLKYDKTILMTEPKPLSAKHKMYLASEGQNFITVFLTDKKCLDEKLIDVGGQPFDMVLSNDEKTLYVACIKENKVVVVNTEDGSSKAVYASINTPSCLTLSADEDLLFVGSHRTRTLTVINLKLGTVGTPVSTGAATGNPMVTTIIETKECYNVYVTKECYSERTRWGATDVITPNTQLNMSVVSIYKPV